MKTLKAMAFQKFRIEPKEEGGKTAQCRLTKWRLPQPEKPKGKKNSPPEPPEEYLLIGYDTEFQSIGPVKKSEISSETQNEILSYQFATLLVRKESTTTVDEASSGIVVPDEGKRIRFEHFLAYAIGDFSKHHPKTNIPKDVILVGHFNRVDFPAFEDFQETARTLASNVRGTMTSIAERVAFEIYPGPNDKEPIGVMSLKLRDTLLLAPQGSGSLAALGDLLGFEKLKLADSAEVELRIKEDMKEFRQSNWAAFRDYAIRDAEVCVQYAKRIIRQSQVLLDSFSLAPTLNSFGTRLVQDDWKHRELNKLRVLGREEVKERQFVKKLGYAVEKTSTPFIDLVHYEQDFVTDCYHGGRNEQFMFGPAPEGDWTDFDLSSAYTTAMSMIGLPDWENLRSLVDLQDLKPKDMAFCSVDFEFPTNVRVPSLPVRTENGIIFPTKGRTTCGAAEICVARNLGAQLTLRRGIYVPMNMGQRVFKPFIQQAIANRSGFKKGTFDNVFWKAVGNSTYGKTAQGLRDRRVYNMKEDAMESLPPSAITQPFYAAFITSCTRAVLGEMLNALGRNVLVFSVTTDGFLSTATEQDIARLMNLPVTKRFRMARMELDGTDIVVEAKHHIQRPIGWRTRGSATLKRTANEMPVLQKGGIKTPQLFDESEQNDYMINLFLNRTSDQKIRYTTGTGLKDIIKFESDFVSIDNVKSLSMEFDWKRVPIEPTDVAFDFNEIPYEHVYFDTMPVKDKQSFDIARKAWEEFKRSGDFCIKTTETTEQFRHYVRRMKMPREYRVYLRKNGGDIRRVRMELCGAFKRRLAGFHHYASISNPDFSSKLNDVGIPCKRTDVENGLKRGFKSRSVYPSDEVIRALLALQETQFPKIDIQEFLYEVSENEW